MEGTLSPRIVVLEAPLSTDPGLFHAKDLWDTIDSVVHDKMLVDNEVWLLLLELIKVMGDPCNFYDGLLCKYHLSAPYVDAPRSLNHIRIKPLERYSAAQPGLNDGSTPSKDYQALFIPPEFLSTDRRFSELRECLLASKRPQGNGAPRSETNTDSTSNAPSLVLIPARVRKHWALFVLQYDSAFKSLYLYYFDPTAPQNPQPDPPAPHTLEEVVSIEAIDPLAYNGLSWIIQWLANRQVFNIEKYTVNTLQLHQQQVSQGDTFNSGAIMALDIIDILYSVPAIDDMLDYRFDTPQTERHLYSDMDCETVSEKYFDGNCTKTSTGR